MQFLSLPRTNSFHNRVLLEEKSIVRSLCLLQSVLCSYFSLARTQKEQTTQTGDKNTRKSIEFWLSTGFSLLLLSPWRRVTVAHLYLRTRRDNVKSKKLSLNTNLSRSVRFVQTLYWIIDEPWIMNLPSAFNIIKNKLYFYFSHDLSQKYKNSLDFKLSFLFKNSLGIIKYNLFQFKSDINF